MDEMQIPEKAILALAALKIQAQATKTVTIDHPNDEYYQSLHSLALNEPWTSRIIRAARSSMGYVDFEQLDHNWLAGLAIEVDCSTPGEENLSVAFSPARTT